MSKKRSLADLSPDNQALVAHALEALARWRGIALPKTGMGREPRTLDEWERAERLVDELEGIAAVGL